MYSPKIREAQIHRLYRLRLAQRRPMTHVVADALDVYLAQHEAAIEDTFVLTESGHEFLRRLRKAS